MLNPKQLRAIELRASGMKYKDIAITVGVALSTVKAWACQAEFKKALEQSSLTPLPARSANIEVLQRTRQERLQSLLDNAISRLEEIIDNPESRTRDVLSACKLAGDWTGISRFNALPELDALDRLLAAGWVSPVASRRITKALELLNEEAKAALREG